MKLGEGGADAIVKVLGQFRFLASQSEVGLKLFDLAVMAQTITVDCENDSKDRENEEKFERQSLVEIGSENETESSFLLTPDIPVVAADDTKAIIPWREICIKSHTASPGIM